MALTRGQYRWRPPTQKAVKSRDIPNTAPPPQNEWLRGKENHPLPPEQVLAKIVEDEKARHDGNAPLGTHKHMNIGEAPNGGQTRDHEWMGRGTQHPLPPGELRAQIVEAYQATHDGEMPSREHLMKELWKRAGVNAVAEPRLMKTGGVPPKGFWSD
jgi:hypothetical protein